MDFKYCLNPEDDEPIMVIDSHVGPDEKVPDTGQIIKGINGSQWAQELFALDSMGKRKVKVYINSPGGSVMDGYSICSAILHTKCKVDTYCLGMAASIAAVAFMCGRSRIMADYGILMFHDPYGGNDAEVLDRMKKSLQTLIAARSGLNQETVAAIMARTTWLDASEAIEIEGLISDIDLSDDTNKGRLSPAITKNDARLYWSESQLIFNSAFKSTNKQTIKNMSDFKKINNRLGLMDEASEDSRLKAIDDIMNKKEAADKKSKEAEDALAAMEEKMKKAKADMDEEAKKNKEAYDALKADYEKMKSEKDEFEKTEKEKAKTKAKDEAKNMIESGVKDGKIANDADVIAKWTAKAEADPEGVRDILDMMGVNKKAANLDQGIVDKTNPFAHLKNYERPEDQNDHIGMLLAKHKAKVVEANKK